MQRRAIAKEVQLYRRVARAANTSMIRYDSAFTDMMGEPPAEPFTVRGLGIDGIASEMGGRVDLKVDVEGAEPLVFAGAEKTIARNPQLTIVMEWSPGQVQAAGFDVAEFLGRLSTLGLSAFDIEGPRLVALTMEEVIALPYRAGIVLKGVP